MFVVPEGFKLVLFSEGIEFAVYDLKTQNLHNTEVARGLALQMSRDMDLFQKGFKKVFLSGTLNS